MSKKYSRGEFLGIGGTLAAGLGMGGCAGVGERPGASGGVVPDQVLLNGKVYTVDDAQPRAEAFAVKNGNFMAVGSNDDIRNLVTRNTEVIDAAGMTVTPGFIDCHCHPSGVGDLYQTNLSDVKTLAELRQLLAKQAEATEAGYWVEGSSYDDTKVIDQNIGKTRRLTRWDLDEAVPNRPVMVGQRGGHIVYVNSVAFERAGITNDTPDPHGGRFERNEKGEMTGRVEELARLLFDKAAKTRVFNRADRQKGVAYISEKMTAAGLTTVHNAGGSPEDLIAYQDAYAAGEMRFRVTFLARSGRGAYEKLKEAGVRTGFGDPWLRIGPVKFMSDGSCSGRSMAMSTPYTGRPNDYGVLVMSQEEVHEAVEEAHRAGWQVAIHANGDVAIDHVLNAYERMQKLDPRPDARHRIEHCTLMTPQLLKRMADGGVIPTPFWTYLYFNGEKWVEYGEEKLKWMFAHRSFLDYGIPAAGASDYGAGPFPPMMAIQSMVTRTDYTGKAWGLNQRVSVDEALRIGTLNGAHISFEEGVKGSITAGKYADWVMLAEDPHSVDPSKIKDIKVVRTDVGGRATYQA